MKREEILEEKMVKKLNSFYQWFLAGLVSFVIFFLIVLAIEVFREFAIIAIVAFSILTYMIKNKYCLEVRL